MTIWAVLPAAGIGRRMGSNIPKQYLQIDGVPLILHSLRRLAGVAEIQKIVVVLHPEDRHWSPLSSSIQSEFGDRLETVMGGNERYQSVLNGLDCLNPQVQGDDWVLVHDAVRSCVRVQDIENLINTVRDHSVGGLLGSPLDNTLKRIDDTGAVIETVDRQSYWNALTPQMFRYSMLKAAFESVVAAGIVITDEASAIEHVGHKPMMVLGSKDNIKITHEADLLLAAQILKTQLCSNKLRIGHGYDVHRFSDKFEKTKPLILAGIELPEKLSLLAHSDGDVILHAVCDAILGALGEGDIGQHFPDTDDKYLGAGSGDLLKQVLSLMDARQLYLVNVDITVVAEVPKLNPHRVNMMSSLAKLLELPQQQVNLKATTTEGLGAIGRKEGIACTVVVLLAGSAAT